VRLEILEYAAPPLPALAPPPVLPFPPPPPPMTPTELFAEFQSLGTTILVAVVSVQTRTLGGPTLTVVREHAAAEAIDGKSPIAAVTAKA
jgi:hypothetical protein